MRGKVWHCIAGPAIATRYRAARAAVRGPRACDRTRCGSTRAYPSGMSPNVSPALPDGSQVGQSQVDRSRPGSSNAEHQRRSPPPTGPSPTGASPTGASPTGPSTPDLARIPDDELIGRLRSLIADSRRVEADLLAHLGEVDARRLFAREAVPSLFEYCTRVLRFSEQEAYLRITVARCSRRHPAILPMLRDGRLHLSGVARLAPHLTADAVGLLGRAAGRTRRQIDELLAEIAPRPDAATIVRRLPDRWAGSLLAHRGSVDPSSVDPPAASLRETLQGSEPHVGPDCVPATQLGPNRVESLRPPLASSPWPPAATGCSSRPAPCCATSSSG